MSKKVETQKEDEHVRIYELGNRVSRSTVAVIDTVVQRGGFKGEELTTIGQLRDQAVQVINMVEAAQGADETEE